MSDFKTITIDGVEYPVVNLDFSFNCTPILNHERTQESGYMYYDPGPCTADICVYSAEPLPVQEKETRSLRLVAGHHAYVGDFECVQTKAIGNLHRCKFRRFGKMEQVAA